MTQFSTQVVAEQPTQAASEPMFVIPIGTRLTFDDVPHTVIGRVGDKRWHLQSDENAVLFLSDPDVARHLAAGHLRVESLGKVRSYSAPPPSPLLLSPASRAANERKHAYVAACLRTGLEFRRSRTLLNPIIDEIACRRQEPAPGFTTVLNWIDEYETFGSQVGTAAFTDRHELKGRPGSLLAEWQERAIEVGIEYWYKLGSIVRAYPVVCEEVARYDQEHGRFLDKEELGDRYIDNAGRLRPPSLRTFQRRCGQVNRFERDWALKGPSFAKRHNKTWQTTARPERPYAHVEVDHTRLDLLIIADSGDFVLGRPNLTVFLDRATAMILGYGLGFEEPSYAAFLQGLKHTTYEKGPALHPDVKTPWPCFGRIENLYVDNGLEFLGDSIEAAGRELGFTRVRLQPRQPWLKGAVERFFGTVATGLLHSLPGTTLSNILERRDHEHLGEAVLTLSEFEALFDYWIRDEYHTRPTRGLGLIRGLGGVPLDVWNERTRSYRTPLLPDPDLFLSLAGEVAWRTIQNDGITWDHIIYEGPELWSLRANAKHRHKREGGATKYQVVRDPFDLSHITVKDPYQNKLVRVEATLAHRAYASGLTLHQHRVTIANAHPRRFGEKTAFDDLVASRARLARLTSELRQTPGRKKVQRKLARFLNVEQSRRRQSQIRIQPPTASPPDFISGSLPRTPLAPPKGGSPFTTNDDLADDLDEIRSGVDWSVYND